MRDYQPQEVIVEVGTEQGSVFKNLKRSLPNIPFTFVEDPQSYLSQLQSSEEGQEAASVDAP